MSHTNALYTHIPQVEEVRSLDHGISYGSQCGAEICTLSLYLLPFFVYFHISVDLYVFSETYKCS